MCSTCGERCSASAWRCATPKRCCSSTTATARSRNSTSGWISACVPTTIDASHASLHRAGEQRHIDAERRAQPLEREEVLLGERRCRRHQRTLHAVLDRAQQRVQRDHRLARADIALQQPLHRRRLREVEVDLGDRALLVLGERERQHLAVARDQVAGLGQRGRDRVGRAQPRDDELQRDSSSSASRRRASSASASSTGKWIACNRVAAEREIELGRQRVGESRAVLLRARRARARAGGSTGSPRSPDTPARSRRCASPRRCRSSSRRSRTGRACRAARIGVPGVSFSASHGWLKNDALICPPLPSATIALTSVRRPRSGRERALTIRPSIATSPSASPSFEIATWSTALSYRRGACSSRSRTVVMPKPRSRFASEGPTPGSDCTSSASRYCGGVHAARTRPVAPGPRRQNPGAYGSLSPPGPRIRTRSGRHADRQVLEPEEPDGAGTCVGADDGAERRSAISICACGRTSGPASERAHALRRSGVRDARL